MTPEEVRDLIYQVNHVYSQFRDEEVAAGKRPYMPLDNDWVFGAVAGALNAMVKVEESPDHKKE